MRKSNQNPLMSTLLTYCALGGLIVLGNQVIAWATTACQVPNPSTVFCTAIQSYLTF